MLSPQARLHRWPCRAPRELDPRAGLPVLSMVLEARAPPSVGKRTPSPWPRQPWVWREKEPRLSPASGITDCRPSELREGCRAPVPPERSPEGTRGHWSSQTSVFLPPSHLCHRRARAERPEGKGCWILGGLPPCGGGGCPQQSWRQPARCLMLATPRSHTGCPPPPPPHPDTTTTSEGHSVWPQGEQGHGVP